MQKHTVSLGTPQAYPYVLLPAEHIVPSGDLAHACVATTIFDLLNLCWRRPNSGRCIFKVGLLPVLCDVTGAISALQGHFNSTGYDRKLPKKLRDNVDKRLKSAETSMKREVAKLEQPTAA